MKIENKITEPTEFNKQLKEAKVFFENSDLPVSLKDKKDNHYADKDGLIEFICGVELQKDEKLNKEIITLKDTLISIITVVTSYVNRYSEKKGEKYKTDSELWNKVISKIPLMGPSKIESQTYSKRMEGVEIAGDFINMILDIVVEEKTEALESFKKFLNRQGENLKIGMEENKGSYNTMTIGVCIELVKVGEDIQIIPKIKQYKVDFSKETSEWTSSCSSHKEISIDFGYLYSSSVFDYKSLNNPEIKKAFDEFIAAQQKAQIKDSTTFFDSNIE